MSNFPLQGQYDMDMPQLTDIFCEIDDFCNLLNTYTQDYMLTGPMKGRRGPECSLAISEIMTILVMFQSSRVRDSKNFYTGLLCFDSFLHIDKTLSIVSNIGCTHASRVDFLACQINTSTKVYWVCKFRVHISNNPISAKTAV